MYILSTWWNAYVGFYGINEDSAVILFLVVRKIYQKQIKKFNIKMLYTWHEEDLDIEVK